MSDGKRSEPLVVHEAGQWCPELRSALAASTVEDAVEEEVVRKQLPPKLLDLHVILDGVLESISQVARGLAERVHAPGHGGVRLPAVVLNIVVALDNVALVRQLDDDVACLLRAVVDQRLSVFLVEVSIVGSHFSLGKWLYFLVFFVQM